MGINENHLNEYKFIFNIRYKFYIFIYFENCLKDYKLIYFLIVLFILKRDNFDL